MHLEMPVPSFCAVSASSAICTAAAIICWPAVMHCTVMDWQLFWIAVSEQAELEPADGVAQQQQAKTAASQ